MDERLLPDKRRYSKNRIVPTISRQDQSSEKPHFKSYDDLLTDALLTESAKLCEAKSKSENTLLAQYRHKRASRAEEELFDLENGDESEDSHEYEGEHSTVMGVQGIVIDETDDQMDADELNAEYIIERQIVNTLLSPPIIVRAPSQSSSINTSFNYHHR